MVAQIREERVDGNAEKSKESSLVEAQDTSSHLEDKRRDSQDVAHIGDRSNETLQIIEHQNMGIAQLVEKSAEITRLLRNKDAQIKWLLESKNAEIARLLESEQEIIWSKSMRAMIPEEMVKPLHDPREGESIQIFLPQDRRISIEDDRKIVQGCGTYCDVGSHLV